MHLGCLTIQDSQGAGHPQSQGAAGHTVGQHGVAHGVAHAGAHGVGHGFVQGHAANDLAPINIVVKMPSNTKVLFIVKISFSYLSTFSVVRIPITYKL